MTFSVNSLAVSSSDSSLFLSTEMYRETASSLLRSMGKTPTLFLRQQSNDFPQTNLL